MKNANPNIYNLLLRKKAGLCDEQESRQADQLIANNPQAAALWKEICKDRYGVWERTDSTAQWNEILPYLSAPTQTKRAIGFSSILKVAAVVAVAVVLAIYWHYGNQQDAAYSNAVPAGSYIELSPDSILSLPTNGEDTAMTINPIKAPTFHLATLLPMGTRKARIVIATSKAYRLYLPDGTLAFINSNTTLDYDFTEGRKISLSGEAYFEVRPDSRHPLVISTPRMNVEVLGTKFNINTYGQGGRTILVEGAINIITTKDTVRLSPGHQAQLDSAGRIKVSETADDNDLDWINGTMNFINLPIAEVVELARNHFSLKIALDHPEADTHRFSGGIFWGETAEHFASTIKEVEPAYISWMQGDTLILGIRK